MSLEQLNTISSETLDTLMRSSLETYIQQWLNSVGLTLAGPVYLDMTKTSPNILSIDITRIASCAKNSATAPTTGASPLPSPNNPASPSPSSNNSNQNTSPPSPLIDNGKSMLPRPYLESAILQLSQVVEGGSMADEMTPPLSAKQLLTILKAALLT